jgi:penicillin amidase
MRRLLPVLGALLMLLVVAGGIALAKLRTGPGLPSGESAVPGLAAPVDVLWDSAGVPHIFASSVEDAFFAQGMAHARQRLWQMEFFRRVATGTLSEVLGESALPSDRFLRTLGMSRVAGRAEALLDADTRLLLDAYVDGVNQALSTWAGPLPPEFVVLRFRPRPFSVEDVLAIERIMAWDLTQYDEDLVHAALMEELDREAFERVRWRFPSGGTTIVDGRRGLADRGSDGSATASGPGRGGEVDRARLLRAAAAPEGLRDVMRAVTASRASNAWVVGGSRTASGMPIVANDMHLGLSRPALFYLVGLHAPGLDVVGMSIPGAPGVAAGRSGAVAWGYTNAMVDDADFFVERVDPADTARYLTPDGSAPFDTRIEVIDVSGWPARDSLVVRETRNGPIMTPVESRLDGELVALRWVAHADSSTLPAILAMNRAANAAEFEEALRGFRTINQNVVFADTAGLWGYRMAGRVPLRGGDRPPIAPRPGWTGDSDWTGFLRFEEHPSSTNPETGFVVTANNRQQTDSIGGLVSGDMWFPPWRAERITRLVEASDTHDVPSTHAIQLDVRSLQGERFAATAAEGYRGAGDPEAAALLDAWDGTAAADRIEPTLFEAWYEGVRRELRREVYGADSGFVHMSAVDRWIDAGLPGDVSTRAATGALDRVGSVEWGRQHYVHLDHPLGSVPLLQRLFGFSRTDIPVAGTGATVDVAGHTTDANGRYRVVWGASQRHVSDLSEDAAWFVLPGGQSGYPAGAHSSDQLRRWLEGGLMRLPLGREEAEARTMTRWRLTPSNRGLVAVPSLTPP